jgi:hypothetical protein
MPCGGFYLPPFRVSEWQQGYFYYGDRMNNGWIRLHRKTIDCGFFTNPSLSHFWIWCLLKATYEEYDQTVGFQNVHLLPGQFVYGRKTASAETGLSERTIRTCVETLLKLENLTIKSTNKFSVLTISKWDTYQKQQETNDHQTDQQPTNKRPTNDHKQEVKKNKNEKNNWFVEVWERYPNKDGRQQAEKHFNATVKTGEDFNNIKKALNNYLESKHVKAGFIKNGSTWFNNWRDWVVSPVIDPQARVLTFKKEIDDLELEYQEKRMSIDEKRKRENEIKARYSDPKKNEQG